MKDSSKIKLFGKTISVSPEHLQSYTAASISSLYSKDESSEAFTCTNHEDNSISLTEETLTDATTSSGIGNNHTTQGSETGSLSSEKEEPSESSASQENTLKKPDKILPCPRCNSMDTKFCYYNNYNINQPRNFCKKCQRYWTAGGTMRNVAVGLGRRKNKNLNYGHIMVSDADVINGVQFSSLKQNSFVIFGSDRSIDPKRSRNCAPNDFLEHSGGSSIQKSSSTEKGCNAHTEESGFQNPWTASGIPVMFYQPTSCWNGSWAPPSTSPTFCALGKHSREGIILKPSNLRTSVLIPKTLRINDPNEAAKSSIWSAIGIKNEKIGSRNGTSLFKAFAPKGNRNNNVDNASVVLQANPAALCRSLNFKEGA